MTIEEIKEALDNAWHEIGHASAHVGAGHFLTAWMAVDRARDSIQKAHDALEEIDSKRTTTRK